MQFAKHILSQTTRHFGKFRKDFNRMKQKSDQKLPPSYLFLNSCILRAKLNHYGICGISNNWFKSYLFNCNQFVFINGYDSGLAAITCGFPQGCTLIKQENFVKFTVDINNVLCQSNSILKK